MSRPRMLPLLLDGEPDRGGSEKAEASENVVLEAGPAALQSAKPGGDVRPLSHDGGPLGFLCMANIDGTERGQASTARPRRLARTARTVLVLAGIVSVGLGLLAGVTVIAVTGDVLGSLLVGLFLALPGLVAVALGRGVGRNLPAQMSPDPTPPPMSAQEAASGAHQDLRGREVRPTFAEFLSQLARLSDQQARELAEIERLLDWRRDHDLTTLVDDDSVATLRRSRMEEAIESTRRTLGRDGSEAAQRRATEILAQRRPSWPGMGVHRPLHLVTWAGVAMAAIVLALDLSGVVTSGPAEMWLLVLAVTCAGGGALGSYLAPPSRQDLRSVVGHAAVAHAAGPALEDGHFAELAGGWYAVLEGRWSRGRRPYRVWGCLFASIIALALLGLVLEATGAGR